MKESWEKIGSRTAKGGFANEGLISEKFNIWQKDDEAKTWLEYMEYVLSDIKSVNAKKLDGRYKTDVIVKISLKNGSMKQEKISCKNQNETGYNHIGRNSVEFYSNKFGFTKITRQGLKKFCGDIGYSPKELYDLGKITMEDYERLKDTPLTRVKPPKESKGGRFYFEELDVDEQKSILEDFRKHLDEILSYIIRGEGEYQADWMLITKNLDRVRKYHLESINESIKRASGEVRMSKENKSSFRIGSITVQRKGGTGGACDLQFKWSNIFPE